MLFILGDNMYRLKTSSSFDSAHFLAGYEGKCANIHGHRWKIEAEFSGEKLAESGDKRGMLIDFGDIKSAVRALADSFDHALIYEEKSMKAETVAVSAPKISGLSLYPSVRRLRISRSTSTESSKKRASP